MSGPAARVSELDYSPLDRKLTTILAADVAGYSRLTAADEEATVRTLRQYREIIFALLAKHGGRLINTAGNSALVEFGSPVEAVRCAISIQEELAVRNATLDDDRKMLFRIGINVGDVIVEGDNIFGDAVNVAARLESIAAPGSICISGATFEQVKNKLSIGFRDLGPQAVKNIPQPVPTFQIIGAPVSMPGRPEQPLRARRHRRTAILAAAGIAAIALLGLGAYVLIGRASQPETGSLGASQINAALAGKTARFERRAANGRANLLMLITFHANGLLQMDCKARPDFDPDHPRKCPSVPETGRWQIEGKLLCLKIRSPACFRVERDDQGLSLHQVPPGGGILNGRFTLAS